MAKRILVVDDDPDIVRLLVRNLTDAGYDVTGASGAISGAQATGPFDVLLLDLALPNGTVEDIVAAHPYTPVVTMSGMPQAQLRKPFSRDELLTALQNSMGRTT